MSKKQKPAALTELEGIAVTGALYIGAQLLLSFLAVRGILAESRILTAQCIVCALSVLAGSLYAVKRTHFGTLPSAMLVAGGFAAILLLLGLSLYDGIAWRGEGGVLLITVLASGVLSGLAGSRAAKRKKKKQSFMRTK